MIRTLYAVDAHRLDRMLLGPIREQQCGNGRDSVVDASVMIRCLHHVHQRVAVIRTVNGRGNERTLRGQRGCQTVGAHGLDICTLLRNRASWRAAASRGIVRRGGRGRCCVGDSCASRIKSSARYHRQSLHAIHTSSSTGNFDTPSGYDMLELRNGATQSTGCRGKRLAGPQKPQCGDDGCHNK